MKRAGQLLVLNLVRLLIVIRGIIIQFEGLFGPGMGPRLLIEGIVGL